MMQEDHSTAVSQLIGCPVVYRGHERESSGPVSTFYFLFILFFLVYFCFYLFIYLFTLLFIKVCMTTTDAAGS